MTAWSNVTPDHNSIYNIHKSLKTYCSGKTR